MKRTIMLVAVLGIAACSDDSPKPEAAAAPEAMKAGLYEASWTVADLKSTDKTEPATNLKAGATGSTKGCIGEGSEIDPMLFAEDGDKCTASSNYVRGGRISMQLECSRPGKGRVMQTINGTSTAEGFEAEVSATTYLSGDGDYAITRNFTGKRVGECPPAIEDGATADAGNTAG